MKKLLFIPFTLVTCVILVSVLSKAHGAPRPTYYGLYAIKWPQASGAAYYNIYYKEASSPTWEHAVSAIPNTSTSFSIDYLKMWTWYYYNVAAVDYSGKEFWWSGSTKFTPSIRTHTVAAQ